MAKPSSIKTCEKNGGRITRIGTALYDAIRKIRKSILINTEIDEISFEEVTNILTRHKLWPQIQKNAENITEEEILKYAKK